MEESISILRDINPKLLNKNRIIVLSLLYGIGPQTQSKLRKRSLLSWGILAGVLKQLEKEKLIKMKTIITLKGPRVLVDISEKGINQYNDVLDKLQDFLSLKNV